MRPSGNCTNHEGEALTNIICYPWSLSFNPPFRVSPSSNYIDHVCASLPGRAFLYSFIICSQISLSPSLLLSTCVQATTILRTCGHRFILRASLYIKGMASSLHTLFFIRTTIFGSAWFVLKFSAIFRLKISFLVFKSIMINATIIHWWNNVNETHNYFVITIYM